MYFIKEKIKAITQEKYNNIQWNLKLILRETDKGRHSTRQRYMYAWRDVRVLVAQKLYRKNST